MVSGADYSKSHPLSLILRGYLSRRVLCFFERASGSIFPSRSCFCRRMGVWSLVQKEISCCGLQFFRNRRTPIRIHQTATKHHRREKGMEMRQQVGKWSLLFLSVLFGFVVSCGGTSNCINGIQTADYNTSGLQCTKSCDCSNLKYEGYCVNAACISTLRGTAERKGEFRLCKLLQKVGSCEWGQQEAQPTPLTELLWGDCIPPTPTPENTPARCSDGDDNDCNGLTDESDSDPKTCQAGQCACPNGQADCSGACVDTTSSAAHCGWWKRHLLGLQYRRPSRLRRYGGANQTHYNFDQLRNRARRVVYVRRKRPYLRGFG